MFMEERKNTGRIYLMNVDHANTHSSFIEKEAAVKQSNLCCEINLPTKPLTDFNDEKGEWMREEQYKGGLAHGIWSFYDDARDKVFQYYTKGKLMAEYTEAKWPNGQISGTSTRTASSAGESPWLGSSERARFLVGARARAPGRRRCKRNRRRCCCCCVLSCCSCWSAASCFSSLFSCCCCCLSCSCFCPFSLPLSPLLFSLACLLALPFLALCGFPSCCCC